MAKYVQITVKIVREFNEWERTDWGGKYFAVYGEVGNERYCIVDDEDMVEDGE